MSNIFCNIILISQLKFLYPLKTLVFPAFSSPWFGPFPSFFPLREEMRETFFRPSLQPYPVALRKFAWPLWWRGRKCSSWYLHQNVPAAPAHPWGLPREREGWSYMYVPLVFHPILTDKLGRDAFKLFRQVVFGRRSKPLGKRLGHRRLMLRAKLPQKGVAGIFPSRASVRP